MGVDVVMCEDGGGVIGGCAAVWSDVSSLQASQQQGEVLSLRKAMATNERKHESLITQYAALRVEHDQLQVEEERGREGERERSREVE